VNAGRYFAAVAGSSDLVFESIADDEFVGITTEIPEMKKASSWNRVGDVGLVSRLCLLRSNPSVRSAPSFRPDLHARYADARSGGQGWPAFGPPLQRREASLTAASTTA